MNLAFRFSNRRKVTRNHLLKPYAVLLIAFGEMRSASWFRWQKAVICNSPSGSMRSAISLGEDRCHPLAPLMEFVGTFIKIYEDEHVPEPY